MHLRRKWLLAIALAALAGGPVHAIDFIVDDNSSDPDVDPIGDDADCITASNKCSLRAAIEEANERTGPHTITFDPSVTTITLTADLPDIRAQVLIDGTNPGAPGQRVNIDGGAVNGSGGFDCFDLLSTGTVQSMPYAIDNPNGGQGSTITNLAIGNCTNDGINASGHGYTFSNNRIGTTPIGTAAAENDGRGIILSGTIPPVALPSDIGDVIDDPLDNIAAITAFATSLQGALSVIASPNFIVGNLISGNSGSGIELSNGMTTNTYVSGNIVGLDLESNAAIPNGTGGGDAPGIAIKAGAYGNVIGPGNIISGNTNDGIRLSDPVILPNFVMGNLIGIGAAPVLELGNGDHGIELDATLDDDGMGSDNPTGYTAFIGPANIISDNKSSSGAALDTYSEDAGGISVDGEGVRIFGNAIGMWAFPAGIDLSDIGIQDPLIDTGNAGNGIVINSSGHQIGGSEAFEANLILRNARHGILVKGAGTLGTIIRGNFIGVAPLDGFDVFTLGNAGNGIAVSAASGTIIGGTGEFDDNVIAGNGINGIALRDGASTSGWSNLIQRNQIYANGQDSAGIAVDLEHDKNMPEVQPDPAGADPNTSYANFGQNQPTICTGTNMPVAGCAAPAYDAGTGATTASWTLETRPDATLRMEYFALRPSGMTFLFEQAMTTDAAGLPNGAGCVAGICTFTGMPDDATDTRGQSIVMTVTDLTLTDVPPVMIGADAPANNTSEYSLGAAIPQEVAFGSATYSAGEASGMANITVQRLGEPIGTVTVNVVVAAGGSATGGGTDFDVISVNPLTWDEGDSAAKTFILAISNDMIDEADETINFELQNATGALEGTPNTTVFSILDDDPMPAISISDAAAVETDSGMKTFQFTVSLSNPSSIATTIDFATADGSATLADSDYMANSGTITFAAESAAAQTVTVLVNGDVFPEADETFFVNLTNASANATILDAQGAGTVQNDDAPPDLSLSKMHLGNFTQGQTGAQYTLTASVTGNSTDGSTVSVTDALPAGLTATAISGSGWVCTLAPLVCTRNDVLAASASYPDIVLTVDVAANAPATLTNIAVVSGGGDSTVANNTAADVTNIDAAAVSADLSISKTHMGNFTQGQVGATYTITVSNVSGADTDASAVTVADLLPADLTATMLAGPGWNCMLATLSCMRTDILAGGASYPPITLTVDVADVAPAQVANSATVSGGGDVSTANNTATDIATVNPAIPAPDLSIVKSHVGDFAQGQAGATYNLVVSNSAIAPTDGTPVTVIDTLPAGLVATAMAGAGWNCVLPMLSCSRTDVLAAGMSYPAITLTVDVADNAATPQVNAAVVSGGGDDSAGNNAANDVTIITGAPPAPDLSLGKTHNGSFVQGQSGATYSLLVTNAAAAATDGSMVSVTDILPAGLTATAMGGTGWTCALAALSCTRSDALAAGASYPPIVLVVDVAPDAAASLINNANVTGGGDVSPGNNVAADVAIIAPGLSAPDLGIAKSHAGNFAPGQMGATYQLIVGNVAGAPTDGSMVSVVDSLPSGLVATALSGNGWNCVLATLTCTRTDVLAGNSSYPVIILAVNVASDAATPQINAATVSGGGDTSPGNNLAQDSTVIEGAPLAPDLSISKSHTGNFTQGQQDALYTLVVSNSDVAATDGSIVTVADQLPADLVATAMNGDGWTCVLAILSCTRDDVLPAGASYPPIVLSVNVAADAGSPIVNTATLAGGGDASPANDSVADSTVIVPSGIAETPPQTIPATIAASSLPSLLALALAMLAMAGLAMTARRRV